MAVALRVWVVVALSACIGGPANKARFATLAQTPSSNAVYAAPATSKTLPWKIGQWALYRHVSPRGSVRFTRMTVVAEDQCGTWIEIVGDTPKQSERALVCLSPPADPTQPWPHPTQRIQLGILQLDGGEPAVFDFRAGQQMAYIGWFQLSTRWFWSHARTVLPQGATADIQVPAGRFEGVLHETRNSTEVWSHPDVPFGGVLQIRERGMQHELVAFGTNDPLESPVLAGLVATSTTRSTGRRFLALGYSSGYATGDPSSGSHGFHLTHGMRVRDRFDIVAEVAMNDAAAPDPESTFDRLQVLLGLRWSPFRAPPTASRTPFDLTAVYLQAGLGYARLVEQSMTDSETVAQGLAASAVIGWMPAQGSDWSLGFELGDRVGLYYADEGIRHNLMLSAVVQLHLPDFRSRIVTGPRSPARSSSPRNTPPGAASAATYPGTR